MCSAKPGNHLKHNFHKKRKEVCIKTKSTSASHPLKGYDTKPTTIKWPIEENIEGSIHVNCTFISQLECVATVKTRNDWVIS